MDSMEAIRMMHLPEVVDLKYAKPLPALRALTLAAVLRLVGKLDHGNFDRRSRHVADLEGERPALDDNLGPA